MLLERELTLLVNEYADNGSLEKLLFPKDVIQEGTIVLTSTGDGRYL